jgi:hypothetical protein
MAIRMEKPFTALTPEAVRALRGVLGVYELADESGRVVYVGYAGGRSLFGLRGELDRALAERRAGATQFRCEVTSAYLSRWQELLMLHAADHGALPAGNPEPPRLGRLSPL